MIQGGKTWESEKGRLYIGKEFSKKAIRHIIQNPVYAGKITNKGNVYEGNHKPIIDPKIISKG